MFGLFLKTNNWWTPVCITISTFLKKSKKICIEFFLTNYGIEKIETNQKFYINIEKLKGIKLIIEKYLLIKNPSLAIFLSFFVTKGERNCVNTHLTLESLFSIQIS